MNYLKGMVLIPVGVLTLLLAACENETQAHNDTASQTSSPVATSVTTEITATATLALTPTPTATIPPTPTATPTPVTRCGMYTKSNLEGRTIVLDLERVCILSDGPVDIWNPQSAQEANSLIEQSAEALRAAGYNACDRAYQVAANSGPLKPPTGLRVNTIGNLFGVKYAPDGCAK